MFHGPVGQPIRDPADWSALVQPQRRRAAERLAPRWLTAGGFPAPFRSAFAREPFAQLRVEHGLIAYATSIPDGGRQCVIDLVTFASQPSGARAVVAVTGREDDDADPLVGEWLANGRSVGAGRERRERLAAWLAALGVPEGQNLPMGVRLDLVVRAATTVEIARAERASLAVCAVHSFYSSVHGSVGWNDFAHFARVLNPDGLDIAPGVPWRARHAGEVELWMLWVDDDPA